jgi:methyltransferase (TIGR00027 family)
MDHNTLDNGRQIRCSADVVSEIRYLESKNNNPIINDPYACLFISPAGSSMLKEALLQWPFFAEYLLSREKYFDDALNRYFQNTQEAQLVILGSGNDMRAERLLCLKGKKIFEVDFPDTISLKKEVLQNASQGLPDRVTYVGTDVSQDGFIDVLVQTGFNPNEKSVFLLQGLIYYMEPKGVDALFTGLGKILSQGSLLLVDYTSKDLGQEPYPENMKEYMLEKGFNVIEQVLLGTLTDKYFGKPHKEQWWVTEAEQA